VPFSRRAEEFRRELERARILVTEGRPDWYPYDSLSNFHLIDRLMDMAGLENETLLAAGPALDIGCADGDVSFFLESLGADVDAVDHPTTNYNGMKGVQALRKTLASRVRVYERDLDSRFELPLSRYGICLALGLLYHLKNPFYFLETLAAHADYCFLSTRVARYFPPAKVSIELVPAAYLAAPGETNRDDTNFWIFSDAGLKRLLARTNWTILAYIHSPEVEKSDPVRADRDERAFCLLRSGRQSVHVDEPASDKAVSRIRRYFRRSS